MTITLGMSDKVPTRIVNREFLQGMVNRLTVGFFRYEMEVDPRHREYMKRIKSSLKHYERSRNKEYLIDLANYAMREFDFPSMDGTYLECSDSNGKRSKD